MAKSIDPYIHQKVMILDESRPCRDAANAMCEQQIGCVVVAGADGGVTGILTDRDLVCNLLAQNRSLETRISEVMTANPLTVEEKSNLLDVIQLMQKFGVRRVPVVRKDGGSQRCVGILTLDDLIAARSISIKESARIVQAQIYREQTSLPQWRERGLESDEAVKDFLQKVEERSGMAAEPALVLSSLVLSHLCRRLHYRDAGRLIAVLPDPMRVELLDLPAGPDHKVTAQSVLDAVAARFDLDDERARDTIKQFWDALSAVVGEGDINSIVEEFPEDFRVLLVGQPGQVKEYFEEAKAPENRV